MGQKTHPIGFRLGLTRTWTSRWFATKNYADLLHEDVKIRRYIKDQLYHAGISKIDIERSANRARITIFTARPGIIIGRKGSEVEKLKNELQMRTGKEIYLNIEEVIHPELDAQLVAENVALQLAEAGGVPAGDEEGGHLRAARSAPTASASPARAGWAAARSRAASGTATGGCRSTRSAPTSTTALAPRTRRTGTIGVKVWIFKGEVLARRAGGGRGVASRHADAQARQVPQGPARPHARQGPARARRWPSASTGSRRSSRAGSPTARSRRRAWRSPAASSAAARCGSAIFPDKPVTKKPAETRMGKGKGNPEEWVAVVKPGRILYEMEGVPEDVAREAFRTAAQKIGIATKFVTRTRTL